MIHYLTLEDRWMFSEYLGHWGRELAGSQIRILSYERLLHERTLDPGVYVFSAIEELSAPMARLVDALAAQLAGSSSMRILNDPRRVLRRFDLHEKLRTLGLNDFRSHRAAGDLSDVRYPLFVRAERSHDGALSPLLQTAAEVETWIGRALALGRTLEDLMVVEFCDTCDADGWYRKYAAFNVDGRIVPRSLNYGREWMLKFSRTELGLAMAQEELDYVGGNPHEAELREIFEIAGIDYGRIDYSMLEGRVQTWEINLNPTIGRGARPSTRTMDAELRGIREETKKLFYSRFNEAWAALAAASPGQGQAPLAMQVDPAVLAAAVAEERRRWRSRSAILGRGIRLVKPLMKTPLAPLLRTLYRLPRRIVQSSAAPLFRVLARRARKGRA